MTRRRRVDRGFSLLESLIALAIAAGSLAAFYAVGGSAAALKLRGDSVARSSAIALDLAQGLGVDQPFAQGGRTGVAADGSRWRIDVAPGAEIAVDGRPVAFDHLYGVRIVVEAARGGGRAEIVTLRTARGGPAR